MSEQEETSEELILDFSKLDEGPIVRAKRARLKRRPNADAWVSKITFEGSQFHQVGKIRGTSNTGFLVPQCGHGGEASIWRQLKKHGLNNPKTFSSKSRLNTAIRNFERETGMKWPIQ